MSETQDKLYATLVQQQFIDAVETRVSAALEAKTYAKQIKYLDPWLANANLADKVQIYHHGGPTLIPIEEYADYTDLTKEDDMQDVLAAMKTSIDQAAECYVSLVDNLWRRGQHTQRTRLAITKFNAKFMIMFANPNPMDADQTARGWVAWRMKFAGTKVENEFV
jgi:hypothetical protein